MNKVLFNGRNLNVQFGRGGKHQQEHYETLKISPSKDRNFEGRRKPDNYDYENRR